jgi:hypothetical protein
MLSQKDRDAIRAIVVHELMELTAGVLRPMGLTMTAIIENQKLLTEGQSYLERFLQDQRRDADEWWREGPAES